MRQIRRIYKLNWWDLWGEIHEVVTLG